MIFAPRRQKAWAILMRSRNSIDGYREYLLGVPDHPTHTKLFESRTAARAFVSDAYGYIKDRPELRREPHGWKVPVVVRVVIEIAAA